MKKYNGEQNSTTTNERTNSVINNNSDRTSSSKKTKKKTSKKTSSTTNRKETGSSTNESSNERYEKSGYTFQDKSTYDKAISYLKKNQAAIAKLKDKSPEKYKIFLDAWRKKYTI
jgi:hypothetical protein